MESECKSLSTETEISLDSPVGNTCRAPYSMCHCTPPWTTSMISIGIMDDSYRLIDGHLYRIEAEQLTR